MRGVGEEMLGRSLRELNKIVKYIYETLGAQGKSTKQYPRSLKLLEEEKEEGEEKKRRKRK